MTISPDFAVDPLIKAGRLQSILNAYDFGCYPIHVVYSHRKYLQHKVKLFNQALQQYMQAQS